MLSEKTSFLGNLRRKIKKMSLHCLPKALNKRVIESKPEEVLTRIFEQVPTDQVSKEVFKLSFLI